MSDHDALEPFSRLRDRDYAREGLIACEGRIVLEKAITAGLAIRSILCVPSDEDFWREKAPSGTPVLCLPRPAMVDHVGFGFHRGVLALAERPVPGDPATAPSGHALVLWNVTDPDNLGTLIRSAAALGASRVYLGGGCADPFSRKALRASMGNALTFPAFMLGGPEELPLAKGPDGTNRLVAAALVPGALGPGELSGNEALSLVLGNEGWGLPDDVLANCDQAVALPMAFGVDSLNVGAAGAILMWEFFRNRP
ncbi:MAG: RNA methyltransferase [Spirochaetales bacterium]|nr:MAG: RNA methyltransferase [Spirochaetales bacterium]